MHSKKLVIFQLDDNLFKQKKRDIKPSGHYEKLVKDAAEYIFVAGNNPSGLPGSFVVSESEAKGSS